MFNPVERLTKITSAFVVVFEQKKTHMTKANLALWKINGRLAQTPFFNEPVGVWSRWELNPRPPIAEAEALPLGHDYSMNVRLLLKRWHFSINLLYEPLLMVPWHQTLICLRHAWFFKKKIHAKRRTVRKTQMRCSGKAYEHTKGIHSLAQKLWPWIDLAWHTLDNECIHKHTFRPLFILIFIQKIHKHDLRHAVQHNKGNAVAARIKEANLFSYSQHRSRRERHQGTVQE